jgi:hypothetical protein
VHKYHKMHARDAPWRVTSRDGCDDHSTEGRIAP